MKFTKILSLILAAVLMLVCFAACGEEATKNPSNGTSAGTDGTDGTDGTGTSANDDMLLNKGKIVIASEIGYPPFEDYASDGVTPVGLDIDLATEIAKIMGVEIEFVNTAFDGILDGLAINKYDMVISAVTIDAERSEQVDFSTPYIDNYQAIVVKKGSDKEIDDILDLAGLKVGVQTGTTSDKKLEDLAATNELTVEKSSYDQIIDTFSDLKLGGRLDAILCDSTVADGYVAQDPDTYEIVWIEQSNPEQFAIAVKKGNTALLTAINSAMATLEANGTLDDIRSTWLLGAE